eukprot:NODE_5714_length_682_cov_5.475513_g4832_i0.p3 GENE.NODE_5714_length_682_cov_5.475513_g4832_i0~~NODE_5714_length_682_cov_5.475513_g4832_i0.p3  ORF type:complete len:54 (-),score=0.29 NODE_5714_length_682_cov_5.475513_g4832_i0:15-176(-)
MTIFDHFLTVGQPSTGRFSACRQAPGRRPRVEETKASPTHGRLAALKGPERAF